MAVEKLTFAQRVAENQDRKAREETEAAQQRLAVVQEEYDGNLEEIDKLEIRSQFETAAASIHKATGRKAEVVISGKPCLKTDGLRPKIPFVGGSPVCEVMLNWEPSGTTGVIHSIAVVARKRELFVKSGDSTDVYQWHEEKLVDPSQLHEMLFNAYQSPHR